MTSLHGTGEEWRAMDAGVARERRAESAATVAAARARIPQVRMRDVTLRVTDRAGSPLPDLPVEIVLLRHAFPFGDQLWDLDRLYRFRLADTDQGRAWKHRFAGLFNAATCLCYWTERPRNDGPKTEDLQGFPQLEGFHACVDWAAGQGLTVKGHPLFWSIPKCVPDWVQRYDLPTQMKFAEVRVRNLVASAKGRVRIWDLVNEPLWEAAPRNLAQRHWPHLEPIDAIADYLEPVLQWARAEDPDACYLINDYGLEADPPGGAPVAKDGTVVTAELQRRRFLELIARLGDRGCLPNALGLQSHTGGWIDHATQAAVYDQLAAAGLPLHVTEFWAETRQLEQEGKLPRDVIRQRQADYVADYLTVAFGHPAIDAFFFWGCLGHAVEWGAWSSHELLPLYERLHRLLHQEWTTRLQARSDSAGLVQFRGFYGDYALRYPVHDRMQAGERFTVTRGMALPLALAAGLPVRH